MKEKLISLDQIVAKLQEELRYKQDILNQMRVLPDVQACGVVKDGISKCTQALRKIQVCVRFALVMTSNIYMIIVRCVSIYIYIYLFLVLFIF